MLAVQFAGPTQTQPFSSRDQRNAVKLFKYSFVLVAALFLLLSKSTFAQGVKTDTPAAIVNSFYKFHFSHSKSFTKRNVLMRQRWLTAELFHLLMHEFAREDEYAKSHPKESFVPYMEGDPFTNSQEYPTSFRVGSSVVSENEASVPVLFMWGGGRSSDRDQRKVDIKLEKQHGRWLIGNIVNKGDGDDLVVNLKRKKYLP